MGKTGYFDKECRTHDMGVKMIAKSHVDGLVQLRPEWRRDLWNRVRPDTGLNAEFELQNERKSITAADLIVDHLLALVVLLEHREELHDVRVLQIERQLGEGATRE